MINKYKNPKTLHIMFLTIGCLTLTLFIVCKWFSCSSGQANKNKIIESKTKETRTQAAIDNNTNLLNAQETFNSNAKNSSHEQLHENTTSINSDKKTFSNQLSPSTNIPSSEIKPTEALTTLKDKTALPNSIPSLNTPLSKTTPEVMPSEAPKTVQRPILEGCFSINYNHKKMNSHADGEACLKHKNLITIQIPNQPELEEKLNLKSVCILVNGSPVQHTSVQGRTNQFLIGPVAGLNSQVTARFCLGKTQCTEKCVVKRDTFMSALGLDEDSVESKVGWDGSKESSKEDIELEAEVAALDKEKEQSDAKLNNTFTGWIANNYTASCNATSASKTGLVKTISLK